MICENCVCILSIWMLKMPETRGSGTNKKTHDKCSPRQTPAATCNKAPSPGLPLDNQPTRPKLSIDDLKASVETIENDLWGNNTGIHTQLESISKQNQGTYEEITALRIENTQLRRELDLLKAVVTRMDRRMTVLDDGITDLRNRSMRDNILIHNYPHTPNENLAVTMPKVFRETLGIDVDFIRIHRNGVRAQHNGKPVSITAKLSDRSKKDEILNAQKTKKIEKQKLPFFISPQQPPSIVATKNKTYDKFNSLRRQNISARLHRDHILLGDGSTYKEEVPIITNADALQITPEQTQDLDSFEVKSTDPVVKDGSEFSAIGAIVHTVEDVQNMYRKVCIDPYAAAANSRILVQVQKGRRQNSGKLP